MQREINPQSPDGLFRLIQQVKENYVVLPPTKPIRGKPRFYSGLSFLLLAVVAVALRTFKDSELHRLLECDSSLRSELGFHRLPHRTTIGRRLHSLLMKPKLRSTRWANSLSMKFNRPLIALKLVPSMAACIKQLAPVGINVIEKLAVFLPNCATSIVNQPGSRAAIAAG